MHFQLHHIDFDQSCFGGVGWSVLAGADTYSTLAGVLAGFLIAAAAALIVQWYDRSDPDTIALFASGVPALTLSSFLFTILNGSKPPLDPDPNVCSQIWSQWLPDFAMLLIGGAVFLCGLGWALVSYSDNLAVRLIEKNRRMKLVEQYRRFFISLSGCLSLGATLATTCWLIAANVVYLKTTPWNLAVQLPGHFWPPHGHPVKWYPMFFVFLLGIYVMVRSAYLIIWRTFTALQENVDSCIRYVPGVDTKHPHSHGARDNVSISSALKEICIAGVVALGALLASYLMYNGVHTAFSGMTTGKIVGVVVAAHVIARLAYSILAREVRRRIDSQGQGQRATKKADRYAEADAMIRRTPSTEIPEDAIRIKYLLRQFNATTYHVVLFALLGTVFGAALTQGPLSTNWRIGPALVIGGIYPASILLGLSYSVPAGQKARLPEWKMWPGLRLLP